MTPKSPPTARAPAAQSTAPVRMNGLSLGSIPASKGHRIGIYGPGGVGKTTLAASAPGPVAFFDFDQSLPRLRARLTALELAPNLRVVEHIHTWPDLLAAIAGPGWEEIKTIVVDSATVAEELAIAHTIATIPTERGERARNIESYGYGKGYQHVYDTFLPLLAHLDTHARNGRNVILICHECSSVVPNPMGPDWIRYEPRLQTSSTGKASIRLRVKEWCDHLLFIGYDVDVRENKARGSGTATVYPREYPHFQAKSRTLIDPIPLDECFGGALWQKLLV